MHRLSAAVASRHNLDHNRTPRPRRAVVAPYAGTMAAVYGWYPNRFGAKDALRMGNYSLLAYAGQNISLEFFYNGPHSLISRMHLRDTHGATDPGPNH
jgi:hypothetical protein